MPKKNIASLKLWAAQGRTLIVEALAAAGCGHAGGSLSSLDVLTALYGRVMTIDPKRPDWEGRDYFILSKGHSAAGLYTALHVAGYISRDELLSFRQDGSNLCGHPVLGKVPGVEMTTGALGHGLGVANGLALAFRLDQKRSRVFVLLGDGEMQEGSIWEGMMFAAHYGLDNLTAIVDRNGLQTDDTTENLMRIEPLAEKWQAFGWAVRTIDGHDMESIVETLESVPFCQGRPSVVIANTVKGKGIKSLENNLASHGGGIAQHLIYGARAETALELERLKESSG